MCGRYALYADEALVKAIFDMHGKLPPYGPSYNIAPTQDILGITTEEGERQGHLYRWGLVPFWAKEIGSYGTINARAETVASKPAFRVPFRERRCLIPANGYYEWQARPGGKQPFYIHAGDDGLLAFAGIWDRWKQPDGETLRSAAIIVTAANPETREIHDRMPVILPQETWEAWLDPENHDSKALQALLEPAPRGKLACRAVSTRVNSPRNNGPALLETRS